MKKKITAFVLIIAIAAGIFCLNMPDLSVEKITDIGQTLTVYDANGDVCAAINAGQNRINVELENIAPCVVEALIATEDTRFYQHNGIDIKRIFGALWADIKSGGYSQGASTITQQLIKNSHLTNEKTIMRKIKEALLALQLEKRFNKDEILQMYLNFVYFGRGAYGIETAAQAYFGKTAKELSVTEAATLIGVLKAPNKYAPHINMEKCVKRRNNVLKQMEKCNYISAQEYEQYSAEPIEIIEKKEVYDYGYYTDNVLEEAASLLNITVSDLMGSGYSVYTALDSKLQESLQEIYAQGDNFPNEKVQAATAVINNKNGSLCAMIGGREHEGMRVYNRAKARRQPGSCIKPVLVYAPAFENKSITAATMLDDYRKDFNGYSPTNFKEVYYGKVTVRKALSLSLNVPAVEVLEKNGIEYSKDYARKMGIVFDDSDNYLALALGGMRYGASPTEIAGAYRTFAFSGNYIKPWCIEKICDSSGNVLYKHEQQETKVLRESTAYIITDILRDVSKQKSNLLSQLQYNVACKTGTVGYKESGYSDAWCTAYDSNFTVCTWLGYDKTTDDQMLEKSVTGSSYPAGICASVFEKTFNEYGFGDFVQPSSVIKAGVDAYTLNTKWVLCAAGENTSKNQVLQEYFEEGTQPEAQSDYWHEPAPANDFSVQLNEVREVTISLTPSQEFAEYHIYRKNSSGESLIKKISGEVNKKIEFIDGDYTQGDVYYYIPVHKYVISNGAPLAGKKSEEIFLH